MMPKGNRFGMTTVIERKRLLKQGKRVDYPFESEDNPEPVAWVERELAKVRLDDRPWTHRCATCAGKVYDGTEIAYPNNKHYCDTLCYTHRVTDEQIRKRPSPEPTLWMRLIGTSTSRYRERQKRNKADMELHGGTEAERRKNYSENYRKREREMSQIRRDATKGD